MRVPSTIGSVDPLGSLDEDALDSAASVSFGGDDRGSCEGASTRSFALLLDSGRW